MRTTLIFEYASGRGVRATITDVDTLARWRDTEQEWETHNDAHIADYGVELVELGASGTYEFTVPPEIDDARQLSITFYDVGEADSSGTPDLELESVKYGNELVQWDGSQIVAQTGDAYAALLPVYYARIDFVRDQRNQVDAYTMLWYRNGVLVTDAEDPTLEVTKRSNAATLIEETAAAAIGDTGGFRYDAEGAERLAKGEVGLAKAKATIDGAVRTWVEIVGRDSS